MSMSRGIRWKMNEKVVKLITKNLQRLNLMIKSMKGDRRHIMHGKGKLGGNGGGGGGKRRILGGSEGARLLMRL